MSKVRSKGRTYGEMLRMIEKRPNKSFKVYKPVGYYLKLLMNLKNLSREQVIKDLQFKPKAIDKLLDHDPYFARSGPFVFEKYFNIPASYWKSIHRSYELYLIYLKKIS